MAFSQQFLDEVRARTTLSTLIGRSVKLEKAGREHKGCCPFHQEKSPSFYVNDEKEFAHCFGCSWHGDAFRWLVDHSGLGFVDAVQQLAGEAGLEVPVPTADQAKRAERAVTVRGALELAQQIYTRQLAPAGAVCEYLDGRGIDAVAIAEFGIGYARAGDGSLKGSGLAEKLGLAAGLLARREDQSLREMFFDRITIPIHNARGELCGFGARVWPGRRGDTPKFLNSPDGPLFDKGRTLFNMHRAAAAARPQAEGRLIVVEGYFDVIALSGAGIKSSVAPMGTALTDAQLQRLWRVHVCPVLLFDGDPAGQRAALRAAKLALPHVGPGCSLSIAFLPEGKDPDDVIHNGGGVGAIEDILGGAVPMHDFLFEAAMRGDL